MRSPVPLSMLIVVVAFFAPKTWRCTAGEIDGDSGQFPCGPSSLSVAARLLDKPIDPEVLGRHFPSTDLEKSHTLFDLQTAAQEQGLVTVVAELNGASMNDLPTLPIIVAIRTGRSKDPDHFVVLYGRTAGLVQVIDYPQPVIRAEVDKLAQVCASKGLVLAANREQLAAHGFRRESFLGRLFWWLALFLGAAAILGQFVLSRHRGRGRQHADLKTDRTF